MFKLMLFDAAQALRPGATGLMRGNVAGLRRLPLHTRGDLGVAGDLLLARAAETTEHQVETRWQQDASWLLAILSEVATRRGFGPVEWEDGDA
ncbi:MAG: hypothetical protein EA407_00465 [Rhodobacteraceae bacterium]|nr:MAG: hypothetical protein EA407_00465 [Paracoccaceae bacterium]